MPSSDLARTLRDLRAELAQDRTDLQRLLHRARSLGTTPAPLTADIALPCDCLDAATMDVTLNRLTATTSCLDHLNGNTYTLTRTTNSSTRSVWAACVDRPAFCFNSEGSAIRSHFISVACYKLATNPTNPGIQVSIYGSTSFGCSSADRPPNLRYWPGELGNRADVTECNPFTMTLSLRRSDNSSGSTFEDNAWEIIMTETP